MPLTLFTVLMETGLTKIPNSYNRKRAEIESQIDSIEVLILGNSRSLLAINPEYLSHKAYNLSNVSQTIFYNTELGMRYIPRMPRLKCVIMEVLLPGFGVEMIDGIEHWRDFYYAQFWDITYPEIPWYEIKLHSKFFLYQPSRSIMLAKAGFTENLAKEYRSNGWLRADTVPSSEITNEDVIRKRARFNSELFREKRFDENARRLEEFVAMVAARKIPCILISSPVYKEYAKYLNTERSARGLSVIRRLCGKYNCYYYDFLADSRFEPIDFSDCDHSSFIGAIKFSKIINDEILNKHILSSKNK